MMAAGSRMAIGESEIGNYSPGARCAPHKVENLPSDIEKLDSESGRVRR